MRTRRLCPVLIVQLSKGPEPRDSFGRGGESVGSSTSCRGSARTCEDEDGEILRIRRTGFSWFLIPLPLLLLTLPVGLLHGAEVVGLESVEVLVALQRLGCGALDVGDEGEGGVGLSGLTQNLWLG